MKVSTSLALLAAAGANAHYTFPDTIYNGVRAGDWQAVRTTENRYSNGPVTDVSSQSMTCYELSPGQGAPQTLGVTAGSTVSFAVGGGGIFHPGPLHAYLAKVPAGKTAKTFDGKGAVWFKIYQDGPSGFGTGSLKWPSDSKTQVGIPIPRCVENGEYLLRVEHIALHSASSVGGAQLYLSCAQLSISGGAGGIKTPGLVSFPGAYKSTDPGILFNLYYPAPTSYTNPGPVLATC
ncbi:glycoside hydrolase [Cercophora newfieldiana]|uniref:lytic cellulose monooxygenase (C4-dehydrogenating) n=1 Tax=Cercophora newfieldiana TaxID=92897 RepID=A0AA39Y7H8_9PEZI|nr:glycoside hydrolase [Cercophora newfieldiana]